MSNVWTFLLVVSAVPAGYVVVNQVQSKDEPVTIRPLSHKELAQPPIQLREYQEQSGRNDPSQLPKGVEQISN